MSENNDFWKLEYELSLDEIDPDNGYDDDETFKLFNKYKCHVFAWEFYNDFELRESIWGIKLNSAPQWLELYHKIHRDTSYDSNINLKIYSNENHKLVKLNYTYKELFFTKLSSDYITEISGETIKKINIIKDYDSMYYNDSGVYNNIRTLQGLELAWKLLREHLPQEIIDMVKGYFMIRRVLVSDI